MIRLKLVNGDQQKNVVVDLSPQFDLTVQEYLQRIIYICGIKNAQAQDLQLYDQQEFLLPYRLPSQCISPQKFYTVVFKQHFNCQSFNTAQRTKKDKKQIKADKKKRKQKQEQEQKQKQKKKQSPKSDSENQKDSSSQSNSDSSSSSLQVFPVTSNKHKPKKPLNNKINGNGDKKIRVGIQNVQKKVRSVEKTPVIKQKALKNVDNKWKVVRKQIKVSSSSSSSSESELEKKQVQYKVGKLGIKNTNINKPKNQIWEEEKPGHLKQTPMRKFSSSSSSSSEQIEVEQHKKNKQKINQIITTINSKIKQPPPKPITTTTQIPTPTLKPSTTPSQKPPNIPISVRTKKTQKPTPTPLPVTTTQPQPSQPSQPQPQPSQPSQPSSFKKHQQQKWIPITKQILNQWTHQKNQECILMEKNQIRFKVVELDQEKFVPVSSGWICGFVREVVGKEFGVKLEAVTKADRNQGKASEYFKQYQIPFHNMQELQINKITFNDKQKQALSQKLPNISTNQHAPQPQPQPQPQSQPQPQAQSIIPQQLQPSKPPQSLQQFICGQINYYFGQKNYPTDLFMQMHANKDEQKYINCRLMLNFPKIKKVLTNQEKLWEYLANDDKYSSRSYQLDYGRRMIRRKGEGKRKGEEKEKEKEKGEDQEEEIGEV